MPRKEKPAAETPNADLLTLEGAMQFLAVSKPTLYRLLREGKVQGVKVGGQWRFRREELRAHIERKPSGVPLAAGQEAAAAAAMLEETLGREVAAPTDAGSPEAAQVARLVNAILSIAIESRASDVHFEPKAREILVRHRLDGMLHEIVVLPSSLLNHIVDRIKVMCDMNLSERRMPQDGRIHLKHKDTSLDVRVATMPSACGEAVTLRLLDQSNVLIDIDRLGFSDADAERLAKWLQAPNGLILVTGPTGSGKTTVLYSCIRQLAGPTKKTLTIEDPVEYILPHTTQTHVNMRVDLTFATALRALLRQDPDIVMIGELRDMVTSAEALRVALTGHLVFSTMHTNSAAGTVTRLLDLGVEPFLLSAGLLGISSQRLVRRVCPDCAEEKAISPDLLARTYKLAASGGYEIPENARFVQGCGCTKCRQTGYRGRLAIYEVMEISEEIGQAIVQRATTQELHTLALKNGMTSLFADGVRKAVAGVTTLDEVMRVVK